MTSTPEIWSEQTTSSTTFFLTNRCPDVWERFEMQMWTLAVVAGYTSHLLKLLCEENGSLRNQKPRVNFHQHAVGEVPYEPVNMWLHQTWHLLSSKISSFSSGNVLAKVFNAQTINSHNHPLKSSSCFIEWFPAVSFECKKVCSIWSCGSPNIQRQACRNVEYHNLQG